MSQRLKQVDDISLGKNLKKLRKAARLTQNDVIPSYNYAVWVHHVVHTPKWRVAHIMSASLN